MDIVEFEFFYKGKIFSAEVERVFTLEEYGADRDGNRGEIRSVLADVRILKIKDDFNRPIPEYLQSADMIEKVLTLANENK